MRGFINKIVKQYFYFACYNKVLSVMNNLTINMNRGDLIHSFTRIRLQIIQTVYFHTKYFIMELVDYLIN